MLVTMREQLESETEAVNLVLAVTVAPQYPFLLQ